MTSWYSKSEKSRIRIERCRVMIRNQDKWSAWAKAAKIYITG